LQVLQQKRFFYLVNPPVMTTHLRPHQIIFSFHCDIQFPSPSYKKVFFICTVPSSTIKSLKLYTNVRLLLRC
jgi:hypothetical protein